MKHSNNRKAKRKQRKQVGLPPGTLIYTGTFRENPTAFEWMSFNTEIQQSKALSIVEIESIEFNSKQTHWLNVVGLNDADSIQRIGQKFNIHDLQLEDILNTNQRPKAETSDDDIFITLRMLQWKDGNINEEQVSFFLNKSALLSFQERPGDVFNPIRERIAKAGGRMRSKKADYLLYALIDVTVDNYFHLLEEIGTEQEEIEDRLTSSASVEELTHIKKCKNQLYLLRKAIFPLREAVAKIIRGDNQLCEETTIRFFEDVHDHLIQLAELVENYREINTDLREIYLSTLSIRMNEIMKLLTIISTIFIPLSFVAGVYGTNFEVLPEIKWPFGYVYFWLVCISIIGLMLFYFKRKKWL